MQKPNVLVILLDQLTRQALSVCGNRFLKTPHMDALANAGLRFNRAYCASPVCSPSRCSFLTGRMPHETGVEVNGPDVPLDMPNMGEIFRSGGYQAVYAGKWHAGTRRGFDWLGPEYPEGVNRHLGTETDPIWVDQAIAFLKAEHDDPFLLVTSLHNPHDICHWIMGNHELTPNADGRELPSLPKNFARDQNEPEFVARCRERTYYGNEANWTVDWDESDWRQYLFAYYRLVERVDELVGRVLTALDEAGLADDTLVLLTSDHGEGVAEHEWVVKLMLYESVVGVPLMMRLPNVIQPEVNDRLLISGVDILPTLCDFAEIPYPSMTGVSFKPVVDQGDFVGRDFVVSQLASDTKDLAKQGRMVCSSDYKYVVFSEGERSELFYHLKTDPGEAVNLVNDPAYKTTLERHRAFLADWCQDTGDPFVTE